jgi:hypothetical protein
MVYWPKVKGVNFKGVSEVCNEQETCLDCWSDDSAAAMHFRNAFTGALIGDAISWVSICLDLPLL